MGSLSEMKYAHPAAHILTKSMAYNMTAELSFEKFWKSVWGRDPKWNTHAELRIYYPTTWLQSCLLRNSEILYECMIRNKTRTPSCTHSLKKSVHHTKWPQSWHLRHSRFMCGVIIGVVIRNESCTPSCTHSHRINGVHNDCSADVWDILDSCMGLLSEIRYAYNIKWLELPIHLTGLYSRLVQSFENF